MESLRRPENPLTHRPSLYTRKRKRVPEDEDPEVRDKAERILKYRAVVENKGRLFEEKPNG